MLIAFAVLALLYWPNIPRKEDKAEDEIDRLNIAVECYTYHCKSYPLNLESLMVNPQIEGWQGSYLNKKITDDPWGTSYRYRMIEGKPHIDSSGPDKQFDTEDSV